MARTRESDQRDEPDDGVANPARPVRTCVGCRTREPASDLLRVVVVDGVLVPDPRRREPGRGAWVHPDPSCLHRAERRSAFPRALRVRGPLDTAALHALLDGESPPATGPERHVATATPHQRAGRPDEPAVKHQR